MRRDDVLAWLETRRPAPPAALRERLRGAIHDADDALAAHLARVGDELLRRVMARPAGGRELALDLLAADAFATYAFEATYET
jgi:hypothetical protein